MFVKNINITLIKPIIRIKKTKIFIFIFFKSIFKTFYQLFVSYVSKKNYENSSNNLGKFVAHKRN